MYQMNLEKPIHVYFVGIGGISMSGLAKILKSRGFTVSGSDRSESPITRQLSAEGIDVIIGQAYENITKDIDLVVFTAAIHPDNAEYKATVDTGIPFISRAELLGQIMKGYRVPVGISGTHGKTTTTSMLSEILMEADTDPTLSIGGILDSIGGNVRVGSSDFFVAEACEYTNSFLSMFPKIGVILNIDADHLDFFKDLNDIRSSFRKYAQLLPADGTLIINTDIPDVRHITDGLECAVVTYGSKTDNAYYPTEIQYDDLGHPSFTLHSPLGEETFTLIVPGEHNIYNAIAAIAAADLMDIPRSATVHALRGFGGTKRRFDLIGKRNGFTIIDDYAHHPTEIEATLKAAQNYPHKTLYCVFQPHTYTRTKSLLADFAKALTHADVTILADIYAARETDTLGISAETLQEEIKKLGHDCLYFDSFKKIEEFILTNCQEDDLLITMGAGNVDQIAKDLVSAD